MVTSVTKSEQKVFHRDFNLKISTVNSVLKECLTKIELMACLPQLLDSRGKILELYIPNKPNLYFVLNTFSKFRSRRSVASDIHEKLKQTEKTKKNWEGRSFISTKYSKIKSHKVHSAVARAVQIIANIQCLLKQREIYLKNIPKGDNSLKLARFIEDLIYIYTESTSLTGQDIRKKDEGIRKAFLLNQTFQKEIEAIQHKQLRKKEEFVKVLSRKNNLLKKCIHMKIDLQNENKAVLSGLRYKSEYEMLMEVDALREAKKEMEEAVISANEHYNSLLNSDLLREKKIKHKLGKIEAQLTSWISKYDTDIREKRLQFEDLQDQFSNICTKTEVIENKLDDVNILYYRFKTEEEHEEGQKLEEIVNLFVRNNAAFKIQRYWREYRKIKLAHRKGGKEKKKKR